MVKPMKQSTNILKIIEQNPYCIQVQTRFGIIRINQNHESDEPYVKLNFDVEDGNVYFFRKRGKIIDIGIDKNSSGDD